jgi:hypothetical protein
MRAILLAIFLSLAGNVYCNEPATVIFNLSDLHLDTNRNASLAIKSALANTTIVTFDGKLVLLDSGTVYFTNGTASVRLVPAQYAATITTSRSAVQFNFAITSSQTNLTINVTECITDGAGTNATWTISTADARYVLYTDYSIWTNKMELTNLAWSNAIVQTNAALQSQLTNRSAIREVWLLSGTNLSSFGSGFNAVANAYGSSISGDTIYIGAGVFNTPGYITRPVNLIGLAGSPVWDKGLSRFTSGSILTNSTTLYAGYSNSVIDSIGFEECGDPSHNGALRWDFIYSDQVNQYVHNVAVGQTSNTASSILTIISGSNIKIDGLSAYNGGGLGIVFQGVSNVVAQHLYNWHSGNNAYDALYIESHNNSANGSKGGIYNLTISGVVLELATNANGAVRLESYDDGAQIYNVKIQEVQVTGDLANNLYAGVVSLEQYGGGSVISNVSISDIHSDQRFVQFLSVYASSLPGTFTNIYLQNCSINNTNTLYCYANEWHATNGTIHLNNVTVNGTTYNAIDDGSVWNLRADSTQNYFAELAGNGRGLTNIQDTVLSNAIIQTNAALQSQIGSASNLLLTALGLTNLALSNAIVQTNAATANSLTTLSNYISYLTGWGSVPGLFGWWKLNEGSGSNSIDSSIFSRNGTWSGNATGESGYYSAGRGGYVGVFDGQNTTVTTPLTANMLSSASGISLTAWIRPNADDYYKSILGMRDGSVADFYVYRLENTGFEFGFRNSAGTVFHSYVYAPDTTTAKWCFVSMTYDGTTLKSYFNNGDASNAVSANGALGNVATPFTIGSDAGSYFPGKISDVRVYNRAISGDEVKILYNDGYGTQR